jgi:hypothetical protein
MKKFSFLPLYSNVFSTSEYNRHRSIHHAISLIFIGLDGGVNFRINRSGDGAVAADMGGKQQVINFSRRGMAASVPACTGLAAAIGDDFARAVTVNHYRTSSPGAGNLVEIAPDPNDRRVGLARLFQRFFVLPQTFVGNHFYSLLPRENCLEILRESLFMIIVLPF